jgi:hypothetical protein
MGDKTKNPYIVIKIKGGVQNLAGMFENKANS